MQAAVLKLSDPTFLAFLLGLQVTSLNPFSDAGAYITRQ